MKDSLHDSLRTVHDEEVLLRALDLVRANGLAEYMYEVRLLLDDERPTVRAQAVNALSQGIHDQSAKAELGLLWRVSNDGALAAASLAGWIGLVDVEHETDVVDTLTTLACDEGLSHPVRSAAFRGIFRALFGKLTPAGAAAHRKVLSPRDIRPAEEIRQELDRAIATGAPSPSGPARKPDEQRLLLSDDGTSATVTGSGQGTLPAQLFEIPQLSQLRLQSFNRPVPVAIGDLSRLQHLNVVVDGDANPEANQGALPDEIGRLTELTKLQLIRADINSLPDTIASLPNLEVLRVEGTKLDVVPSTRGLSKLSRLLLANNHLQSLPEDVASCKKLHSVVLTDNQLTEVPVPLRELADLKLLSLRSNMIEEYPDWLAHMANLEHLDLAHNEIAQLPTQFPETSPITRLDLSHNNLTSAAPLDSLTSLQRLDLSYNELTTIPDSVLQLPRLRYLNLRGNNALATNVAARIRDRIQLV